MNRSTAASIKPRCGYPKMAKKVPQEQESRAKKVGAARRPMFLDDSDMLIKATWLYHHRKLTQEQIAQHWGFPTTIVHCSPSREQGLVTVSLRSDALSGLSFPLNWSNGSDW